MLEPGPVQHPVHRDAAHRHVKPDWKRPPGNADVLVKTGSQAMMDGGQRKGDHQRCQNDVRDEQAEVHDPQPAFTSEGHRAQPGSGGSGR